MDGAEVVLTLPSSATCRPPYKKQRVGEQWDLYTVTDTNIQGMELLFPRLPTSLLLAMVSRNV